MGTFNFDFKCNVCRIGRKNRFMAFANKFDMYIENKIETFICCNQCDEMYNYEKIYNDVEFNKLNKIEKQINFIFTYLDNEYHKLKNYNDKKIYLKNIMKNSKSEMIKPLMTKFLNNRRHICMIEHFKSYFIENKLRIFYYLFDEEMETGSVSFRNLYDEPLIFILEDFIKCYVRHLIKPLEKYFDVEEIKAYINDGSMLDSMRN